ncbi:MAG TPA: exodeoxyribonuclease VII small subunit [Bacillota bacterium]|nr:exodeoxyribonuclease VII small subunit [Bacillota bacterium]
MTEINHPNERNYEEAVARLEEIVAKLEAGDLSLEECLTLFEEGISLAKYCSGKLDAAEGKLEILLGLNPDGAKLGPFKLESGN